MTKTNADDATGADGTRAPATARLRSAWPGRHIGRSRVQQDATQETRLSPAARHRGLFILLVSTFFAWGGFFMVIPMISVHFVDELGWTAAAVGLVLAARQLFQQGLTPLSGVLADRLGAKPLIAIGMIVRAVGFAAMGFAETYELLMLSAIVAAIGGALFESPRSAGCGRADRRSRTFDLLRQDRRCRRTGDYGWHPTRGVAAGSGLPPRVAGCRRQLRADPGHDPRVVTAGAGGGQRRPAAWLATGVPRSHISLVHRFHGWALVYVGAVLDHAAVGGCRHLG